VAAAPAAGAASTTAATTLETEPDAPNEPVAEVEEQPSANGDGDWGYTPMSEWGIDGGSE
jgi:hypothetical protein